MKGIVKRIGNGGFHVMLKKTDGFSEGDEVSIVQYDKTKDETRCQFDSTMVKDAVAEALAEARG